MAVGKSRNSILSILGFVASTMIVACSPLHGTIDKNEYISYSKAENDLSMEIDKYKNICEEFRVDKIKKIKKYKINALIAVRSGFSTIIIDDNLSKNKYEYMLYMYDHDYDIFNIKNEKNPGSKKINIIADGWLLKGRFYCGYDYEFESAFYASYYYEIG